LDHMDWMTDHMINEEMTALTEKMDHVRGKVFWRTFADDVHAAPLYWLNPDKVDDSDDRVGMYWTTWIAHLKDATIEYRNRVNTHKPKGIISNLITGAKIVTFPLWKPLVASTLQVTGQAKHMETFYKYQKEDYDAFREGLLHARPSLLESMPLKKGSKMVWVDVGGGTARNLEFFTVADIRKYFKEIVILDISASLLEMASRRIKQMGLEDMVRVVEHDCTIDSVFAKLPTCGTVDVITMSYSFSMIPNKAGAIVNSNKLLKKDGLLMIADFFAKGKYDDSLPFSSRKFRESEAEFHKWWFAHDSVFLLTEKETDLGNELFEVVWDERFRGSVPFIPFLKPYHGVYVMKKK